MIVSLTLKTFVGEVYLVVWVFTYRPFPIIIDLLHARKNILLLVDMLLWERTMPGFVYRAIFPLFIDALSGFGIFYAFGNEDSSDILPAIMTSGISGLPTGVSLFMETLEWNALAIPNINGLFIDLLFYSFRSFALLPIAEVSVFSLRFMYVTHFTFWWSAVSAL